MGCSVNQGGECPVLPVFPAFYPLMVHIYHFEVSIYTAGHVYRFSR